MANCLSNLDAFGTPPVLPFKGHRRTFGTAWGGLVSLIFGVLMIGLIAFTAKQVVLRESTSITQTVESAPAVEKIELTSQLKPFLVFTSISSGEPQAINEGEFNRYFSINLESTQGDIAFSPCSASYFDAMPSFWDGALSDSLLCPDLGSSSALSTASSQPLNLTIRSCGNDGSCERDGNRQREYYRRYYLLLYQLGEVPDYEKYDGRPFKADIRKAADLSFFYDEMQVVSLQVQTDEFSDSSSLLTSPLVPAEQYSFISISSSSTSARTWYDEKSNGRRGLSKVTYAPSHSRTKHERIVKGLFSALADIGSVGMALYFLLSLLVRPVNSHKFETGLIESLFSARFKDGKSIFEGSSAKVEVQVEGGEPSESRIQFTCCQSLCMCLSHFVCPCFIFCHKDRKKLRRLYKRGMSKLSTEGDLAEVIRAKLQAEHLLAHEFGDKYFGSGAATLPADTSDPDDPAAGENRNQTEISIVDHSQANLVGGGRDKQSKLKQPMKLFKTSPDRSKTKSNMLARQATDRTAGNGDFDNRSLQSTRFGGRRQSNGSSISRQSIAHYGQQNYRKDKLNNSFDSEKASPYKKSPHGQSSAERQVLEKQGVYGRWAQENHAKKDSKEYQEIQKEKSELLQKSMEYEQYSKLAKDTLNTGIQKKFSSSMGQQSTKAKPAFSKVTTKYGKSPMKR